MKCVGRQGKLSDFTVARSEKAIGEFFKPEPHSLIEH